MVVQPLLVTLIWLSFQYRVLCALDLNAPFKWTLELLIQKSIGSWNYRTGILQFLLMYKIDNQGEGGGGESPKAFSKKLP